MSPNIISQRDMPSPMTFHTPGTCSASKDQPPATSNTPNKRVKVPDRGSAPPPAPLNPVHSRIAIALQQRAVTHDNRYHPLQHDENACTQIHTQQLEDIGGKLSAIYQTADARRQLDRNETTCPFRHNIRQPPFGRVSEYRPHRGR